MAKEHTERDYRIPVLLLLGVIIWFVSCFPSEPTLQTSQYFLAPATAASHEGSVEVIRISQEQVRQESLPASVLAITTELPCGALPPELTQLFNLPLPINLADQESLTLLSGIGPKLAERIIAFRQGQRRISGPEDFIRVKGIGPKLTERLSPFLCFASPEAKQ
ncbi:MAG: helix-hairpin-helix domain-containing protein [Candidatus Electrothrix sp. ATG2]|nr:helix-hairpin-helix domain-containing protein [Candidatus Electrothrix sp. ATG2]